MNLRCAVLDLHWIDRLSIQFRFFNLFQDSIRLHCLGENLVIPLYAYPTIDSKFFPSKINFGSVPLGQESYRWKRKKNNFINNISFRKISLKAEDNDFFDFCCSLSPSCSAFSVSPWSGKISGESELKITYCPTEFVTSSTKLRITFSTFDRKVLEVGILKFIRNWNFNSSVKSMEIVYQDY